MNAPTVWILIPGAAAVLLFFFRRWQKIVILVGIILAILLAWLAWRTPIGMPMTVGSWSFKVLDTLPVLGRQFVLTDADRPLMMVIYLSAAFWFGGSIIVGAGPMFVPLGFGLLSLLTAALAVDPFLYAALLIEMAVLVSIPILCAPGRPLSRGALRFLTLQTMGMPFILYSGWMLAGVEANPGNQELIVKVSLLMGMGFIFLLAIFPFHTWIPMLAEESHPYAAAFVLLILPVMVAILGLGFLDRYTWLRSTSTLFTLLRLSGVLMVLTGGLWAAFQRHLGRILGYAVMVEIGLSLLAIGTQGSIPVFFASLLPRVLGLGVWALALSTVRLYSTDLHFSSIQGLARGLPVASAALVIANFSIAGFPILAGFPMRIALMENLARHDLVGAFLTVIGSIGLFAGGLRTFAVLITGPDQDRLSDRREVNPENNVEKQTTVKAGEWQITESRAQLFFLIVGILLLILVGLFPQWFFPTFANVQQAFKHLMP